MTDFFKARPGDGPGSPLNALVMSVARYFARLPTAVSIAAWVDDLHFSMRTPPHPPCAGHAGGCTVCTAAYHRAVEMEGFWRAKALALNLPLSEGKGHSAAQGGPFTGIMVDTRRGRFLMLADKLASTRAALTAALASDASTPRLLASCRGKAFHYGCAIPFLARLCPALTQAIQNFNGPSLHRETQQQPTPRGRRPPLYPRGGGSSLWPQKRWERPDRAGGGPPIWGLRLKLAVGQGDGLSGCMGW